MKVYDFLGYCVPSQEIEIWIKPLFSNRYTRYTADICDEIRNDQWTMDTLKAATLNTVHVNMDGVLVLHGFEA